MKGIATFDIEAVAWDQPIAVGFYDGEKYFEFLKINEDHDVIGSFLDFLKVNYQGIRIYAHNAGEYDNKFILQSLHRRGQRVAMSLGQARLEWLGLHITFEDSYLMLSRRLSAICYAFNIPMKLDWDHSQTKNIWEMGDLEEFRAYLKRDCVSLSEAIAAYAQELISKFGVAPSTTMALTSVKAFNKRFYPVSKINANFEYENRIRQATFGGRNEVYNKHGLGIYFYDVRSMYVSCYDTPVPIGKMSWTSNELEKGTVTEAIVKVPTWMNIGPLPYRYRPYNNSGYGHLMFPVGTFPGVWDTIELMNAVNLGCDVTVIKQLACEESPILDKFGKYIAYLREQAENEERERIWKNVGVRLSGKFGQHRIMQEIKHATEIEDYEGWCAIDDDEIYFERMVAKDPKGSPYIKPAVNMRVRSEARIRHLRKLLEAEDKGTLYYCDNDSVCSSTPLYNGRKAGELQLLDYAKEAFFIRCKFYGYLNRKGHLNQRTAGYRDFKLTEQDFRDLLQGKTLYNTFQSLSHWKSSLTEEGVKMIDRSRSVAMSRGFDNRESVGLKTRPIELGMKDGEVFRVKRNEEKE